MEASPVFEGQSEEDGKPYTLEELLALRGFRKANFIDRFILEHSYYPPFLQPGNIAPIGDNGDPEVRERIINARKQKLWQAMRLPEV